jgi:hypothetical protein
VLICAIHFKHRFFLSSAVSCLVPTVLWTSRILLKRGSLTSNYLTSPVNFGPPATRERLGFIFIWIEIILPHVNYNAGS